MMYHRFSGISPGSHSRATIEQGYSGSTVQRKGNLVEKISSDLSFTGSSERQRDLSALSQKIAVLPRIDHIDSPSIYMEYVDGQGGLTIQNAQRVGNTLRLLHGQTGYPHACMTGLNWLIELSNENLAQMNLSQRISYEVISEYPVDALIHSEPQWIEKKNGAIVFIDFEGMGMGSRYQDLGHIYYNAIKEDQAEVYSAFIHGYQSDTLQIDLRRVKQLAGIISLAYVGFALAFAGHAEAEKRMQLGLRLLGETG